MDKFTFDSFALSYPLPFRPAEPALQVLRIEIDVDLDALRAEAASVTSVAYLDKMIQAGAFALHDAEPCEAPALFQELRKLIAMRDTAARGVALE